MSIALPITSGTIGNLAQLTVDARALHQALEVKRDFSNWIKARITKYGFIEGEDYEKNSMIPSSPNLANRKTGFKTAIEYRLSVNMGKELAMVENNECGRMVRRYFIECERRLMNPDTPTTVVNRKPLDKLVKVWAVRAAIPYQQAWTMLDSHFCLTDIKDLPLSKLQEAIAWVQARIDALPPEQPKALPAPKKDKYELFIEKLENVRQRREKEMIDLMSEALVLTQPLKWGLDYWHPICYATRKWVEEAINSPSKVGAFGDKELPIMFGKLADSVRFAAE
ncbi:antA/AntB antirepressor family protein [Mailhella sp.]|uniref:antA/AntB antirepressor family protein n=1 Tax=Mailhella sp. TaxID=1981029 RepID=UPI004062FDE6